VPLNHADLELMMRGVAAPGDAAMQVRQEQDRRQSQAIEQELRQKMLEQEIRRTDAEEGRQKLMGQKAGEDADQNVLKDMISVNPYLTDDSRAQANKYLSSHPKWGAVGIQLAPPVKKPVPQAGQSSAVAEFMKAREFRDTAAKLGADTDEGKWYLHAADALEKRGETTKPDPTSFEEEKTVYPEVSGSPEIPATSGFLGIGAKPAVPAVPSQPKREVTRKIPVGTAAPTIPASTAPAAPTGKPITDKQGRKWLYKGTMADPTQDRDPANWVPQ
jgi:hypothetical protein